MDAKRGAVGVAFGLIVALTLATGPFGPLDISSAEETPTLGTGSADISVVSTPDSATIVPADHGAVGYYLETPAAVIDIDNLQGNPILEYSLKIDGLGYARTSVHSLAELGEGRQSVVLERDFLDKGFERETYDAQLELVVRGERETVLVTENVTVSVDQ